MVNVLGFSLCNEKSVSSGYLWSRQVSSAKSGQKVAVNYKPWKRQIPFDGGWMSSDTAKYDVHEVQ